MPTIYDLKPKFQGLLRPLVGALADMGVTANQVTVAAAVLSLGTGAWVWLSGGASAALLAVPAVLFVRMALNAIDGMLAREHNQSTKLGAVLNELGDVVSDAGLYLPFAAVAGLPAALVVAVVVLAVMVEMVGVVGVQIGASRRYDGPLGKSDRAFFFGALGLLLGLGVAAGQWVDIVFAIAILLSVLTLVNRAKGALKEVANS